MLKPISSISKLILLQFSNQLASGLKGIISGGISTKDFSVVTKINTEDSKKILDKLIEANIGSKQDELYYFEIGDKLKIAIILIKSGFSLEEISNNLDWRDFEGLTAEILNSKDFAVIKNMMLTKPRMEIDVVGIRLGVAVLIDCKHWNRYSLSSLTTAVQKQIERTKQYVTKTQGSIAVPVIVTLHQDQINFIDKVPIVPIAQLSSFIDEFYGNLDQMKTIKKD